jgi:hypothetical protein
MQTPPAEKLSMVRVRYVLLTAVLVACVIVRVDPSHHLWLAAVMTLDVILLFLVRCESCKSSLYYTAGGERPPLVSRRTLSLLIAPQCPICGKERF